MYGRLARTFLAASLVSLALPSSLDIFPHGFVATTPGTNVSFTCLLLTVTSDVLQSVSWLLNGSSLDNFETDSIFPQFESIDTDVIWTLNFVNIPLEYNQTTIRCRGAINSDSNQVISNEATLLLQDTLSAVSNLEISSQNSTIVVTWTAPFTLDIHGTNIDITYTVNATGFSSRPMLRSVNIAEIRYPIPPGSGCVNYVFTVIPVNGAGEGDPQSIPFSQALSLPQLLLLTVREGGNVIMYSLSMSSPVCDADIALVDKNTRETLTLNDMDLDISTSAMTIVFTNERLEGNRQYSFMVNASNINGSYISSGSTSTYGIVSSGLYRDPLRIQTEYLSDSDAAGVLYGFFHVGDNGIDFTRSIYLALSRNTSMNYELPFGLPTGVYYVHAYVIGQDGLISRGEVFPATTSVFSATESSQSLQSAFFLVRGLHPETSAEIDNCEVFSVDLTVSVECTLQPTSTSTGYLVVGQENSINGARRLLVNRTESGQTQAPVTFQVDEFGEYQVTVFIITENLGILDSGTAYTAMLNFVSTTATPGIGVSTPIPRMLNTATIIIGVGVGLGILVLLAVISIGAVLAVLCCRSRGQRNKFEISTVMKEDVKVVGTADSAALVYEEIGDVRSSFTYTQNILYGGLNTAGVTSTTDPLPEPSLVEGQTHEYELVKVREYQSLDDAYKVQTCSAYGVSIATDGSHNVNES